MREDSQRRKDRNFYPRPPRGGRPSAFPPGRPGCRISIHALREEGDGFLAKMQTSRPYFYPRPPRGGRPYAGTPYHLFGRFLSTPSARRATEGDFLFIGWCCNFYPRPPRGGRRLVPEKKGRCRIFLSTPSARRATRQHADRRKGQMISIHALREEGDRVRLRCFCPEWISIHALREEGDTAIEISNSTDKLFLSTPSARRATCAITCARVHVNIFLSTPSARRATTAEAAEAKE